MPDHPYPPSWVDRLTAWFDRSPVPVVDFYVLIYVVFAGALHIAWWVDGVGEWGSPNGVLFSNATWGPMSLGLIHVLDRVAGTSLRHFRSLVPGDDADDLPYRLTTLPARTVLWITVPAAALLTAVYLSSPDFIYETMEHPLSWVLGGVVVVASYSFSPILAYFLVRHLVLVRRAFQQVEVNVLHQQPLYGLSRLPFATGLAFLAIVNLSLIDVALRETAGSEEVVNFVVVSAMAVLGIAAFLVPLQGIHQRLKRAKEGLLDDNGRHVEIAQRRLYVAVEQGDTDGVAAADTAISSLYRVRDEIARVRTWPWSPGTVRSFLSAVFVPMVVWGLQLFGDRIF